jgi:hypothetical protein
LVRIFGTRTSHFILFAGRLTATHSAMLRECARNRRLRSFIVAGTALKRIGAATVSAQHVPSVILATNVVEHPSICVYAIVTQPGRREGKPAGTSCGHDWICSTHELSASTRISWLRTYVYREAGRFEVSRAPQFLVAAAGACGRARARVSDIAAGVTAPEEAQGLWFAALLIADGHPPR